MILVDVNVPEFGKTFDMEADEDIRSEELTVMVLRLIAGKEHVEYQKHVKMELFVLDREAILQPGRTLREQGIRSGEKLYLI